MASTANMNRLLLYFLGGYISQALPFITLHYVMYRSHLTGTALLLTTTADYASYHTAILLFIVDDVLEKPITTSTSSLSPPLSAGVDLLESGLTGVLAPPLLEAVDLYESGCFSFIEDRLGRGPISAFPA